MKPRIFIASSDESLQVAYAIQTNLDNIAEVTVWDQGIFSPSKYTLEALLDTLRQTDFGIFVFSPEDQTTLKNKEYQTVRDNVIFELGLFIAGLGIDQTAIIKQKDIELFHMPSDLLGLSVACYSNRDDGNLKAALRPACEQIKQMLSKPLNRDCGYLVRYVSHEEPPLIGVDRNTTVNYERAYKLLIYMLQKEKFKDYMAFDLSFERWGELLCQNHMQTCNIANEIFESMTRLFYDHRCDNFRRILIVSPDQLNSKIAVQVLGKFQEQETAWRLQYKDLKVETKVYIYPDKNSPETRRKIQQLHDFALFYDQKESLAIVEMTTSPIDYIENPESLIITAHHELEIKKNGFEDFWRASKKISSLLTVNSEEQAVTVGQPAQEAFNRFNKVCRSKTEQCAIVIETGYFDLRTPNDEDRLQYIADAFWLFEAVQNSCSNIEGSIFLDVFINDFKSKNVCNIKACGEDIDFEEKNNRASIIHELLCVISRKYTSYNLNPENFEVFGMRKTRNKVTEVIKKALRNETSGIYEKNYYDTIVDICITNDAEHINIGYRDTTTDTYKITPLCTALMAQHYFDLYSFALKKKSRLKELWIFDFNRFTERDSVRKGAEASFKLHSWPENFSLHIVNCIYNTDGKTGTIELINGP